jgi:dienelactone hydrolase
MVGAPQPAERTNVCNWSEDEMMHRLLLSLLLLAAFSPVRAEVIGKEVDYRAGDTVLKGYLAYDDGIEGRRPGVLVVHEWWGHNAYARKRARMLAELGYTALAVDMYGEGKQARHPDEAGKFAGEVRKHMDIGEARFMAAMKLLQSQPTVDPDRIAAIGYCFGGGIVLEMARRGVDLDAVVSFHGSLGTDSPARKGAVKVPVLVLTGADDPFVPPEQVEQFRAEMDAAGVDYEIISYPGVKHSFTNPEADTYGKQFGLPLEYNAGADRQSWATMQEFLDEIFSRQGEAGSDQPPSS